MKNKNTAVSFTQYGDGILVPSRLLEEPTVNKKLMVFLVIFCLICLLIMLSIDSSVTGIEESIAIAISFAIFFFLIHKFLGPVWIEFNRNSGKVVLWRNMKKGGRIGDYPIEQVEFNIGTQGFESSSNYAIMLIIPIRSWNKKYVLFDFYNLDPLSIEDKPVAETLVKEIEKFIREFMSGRVHQTFQKKEFTLLSKH